MSDIQKANAKVAIEYYQKILAGENPTLMFVREGYGGKCLRDPRFNSTDIAYFWPKEMVKHKGGSYPKPITEKDLTEVGQYYIADPLNIGLYENFGAMDSSKSNEVFFRQLGRGIIHETKEAAIQHAKVMLGVGDGA